MAYCQWVRSRSRANWMEFKLAQRDATACYGAASVLFSQRCRDKFQSASSAHAWWITLKESVFCVDSSILPLRAFKGAMVSDPTLKTELLSEYFDSKQSHDSVALPLSCHPEHNILCICL